MYRILVVALVFLLGCGANGIPIPPEENNSNNEREMADINYSIQDGATAEGSGFIHGTPNDVRDDILSTYCGSSCTVVSGVCDWSYWVIVTFATTASTINKAEIYHRKTSNRTPNSGGSGSWFVDLYYNNAWHQVASGSWSDTHDTTQTNSDETGWSNVSKIRIRANGAAYSTGFPGGSSHWTYELRAWGPPPPPYTDIGIRVRKSGETIKIGVVDLEATHKLRIRKGDTTYGIPLLATDDPDASPVRIYDGTALVNLVLEDGVEHSCSIEGDVESGSCLNTYDENPNTAYRVKNYHWEVNVLAERTASILSEHIWDTGYYVRRAFLRCYLRYACVGYFAIGETWLKAQLFLKWNDTWHMIKEYTNYTTGLAGSMRKVFDDKTERDNVKGIKGYVEVRCKSTVQQEPLVAISRLEAYSYIGEGVIKALPEVS